MNKVIDTGGYVLDDDRILPDLKKTVSVHQLIDQLNMIEDKNKPLQIFDLSTMTCFNLAGISDNLSIVDIDYHSEKNN